MGAQLWTRVRDSRGLRFTELKLTGRPGEGTLTNSVRMVSVRRYGS